MSLIKCPECGSEVSDFAQNCPKCAYPINQNTNSNSKNDFNQKIVVKPQEGCFLQTLNFGCIVTVIFIVIFVILLLFSWL